MYYESLFIVSREIGWGEGSIGLLPPPPRHGLRGVAGESFLSGKKLASTFAREFYFRDEGRRRGQGSRGAVVIA